jgi:hypothetical protein
MKDTIEMASDGHTKFHEDWLGHSSNIKSITSTVWEAIVLVLLLRGTYDARHWEDTSVMISSFMKIGTGVQEILRFCLRYMRGCNSGITDGRDLWITPLRRVQVPWYAYTV